MVDVVLVVSLKVRLSNGRGKHFDLLWVPKVATTILVSRLIPVALSVVCDNIHFRVLFRNELHCAVEGATSLVSVSTKVIFRAPKRDCLVYFDWLAA